MGQPKIINTLNEVPGEFKSSDSDVNKQHNDLMELNDSANNHNAQPKDKEGCQVHDVIGDFGKFQLFIFIFKILIGITSAFNNLGVSFYAPRDFIGHWCDQTLAAPNGTNSNLYLVPTQSDNLTNSNLFHANHHDNKLFNVDSLSTFIINQERTERHLMANFTSRTPRNLRKECSYELLDTNDQLNETLTCNGHYKYDKTIWLSTIIDEWNLVCDKSWMISMTQSLYMAGFLISYPIFGYLSDRYGRWNSLLIGCTIEILAGFCCAFANSIKIYMIFRLLTGFGCAGRSSSSYLIMLEWAGPRWRMTISNLGTLGWVFGYTILPWITLYFLHFRHMQIFICFYELIFLIVLIICVPESPRWLLTHRNYDKARAILLKAAKFNNLIKSNHVPIDEHEHKRHPDIEKASSKQITLGQFDEKFAKLIKTIEGKDFTKNENHLTILDLFKMKNLRKYLLVIFFLWSSNSFIYYGIALHMGGDNKFVSFSIAGLLEIPSIIFSIGAMKYLPRSTSNLIIYGTTGVLCLIQIPLKYYNYSFLLQCCIQLAKLTNNCAFNFILYQTMELFPTSIRQTAYTSAAFAGRIGSIFAPFVKELANMTNEFVPAILYAVLSFIGVAMCSILPETRGVDLHDTLMEAENFKGVDRKCKQTKGESKSKSKQ